MTNQKILKFSSNYVRLFNGQLVTMTASEVEAYLFSNNNVLLVDLQTTPAASPAFFKRANDYKTIDISDFNKLQAASERELGGHEYFDQVVNWVNGITADAVTVDTANRIRINKKNFSTTVGQL